MNRIGGSTLGDGEAEWIQRASGNVRTTACGLILAATASPGITTSRAPSAPGDALHLAELGRVEEFSSR